MKIIALDGASGTGKSVLIGRLKTYFEATGRVRIERLISKELEVSLDEFKKSGSDDMRPAFCDALLNAYREGYNRLCEQDAHFRKNNNTELIFILDRYLLSLYAIQGRQWGISDLHERCRDIRKPDGQFIIRLPGEIRPEDQLFIDAADEWRNHDFHGAIWNIRNKLSYNQNMLDDGGYYEVRETISQFLQRQG